jgi:hypothetical protein
MALQFCSRPIRMVRRLQTNVSHAPAPRAPARRKRISRLLSQSSIVSGLTGPLGSHDLEQIDAAWKIHFQAVSVPVADTLASLTVDKLRELSRVFGIPRQVFTAFRERKVDVVSVPRTFLAQFAAALITAEQLTEALSLPPAPQVARSYKADVKPGAVKQVSFEQILIEAGVPEPQRAKLMEADRGEGGQAPVLISVEQAEQQTVALAERIEEMRRSGFRFRDQAVLCPGNETISNLAQSLERLGVPVLFLGSLFERPEAKDLFAVLTILTDRRATGLARICCLPEFRASLSDVALVMDHARSMEGEPGAWMQTVETIPGLSEEGRSGLTRLRDTLRGFDREARPWSVLAQVLLDRTRLPDEDEASVFNYTETASDRAGIGALTQKLVGQKIAIIGLGGTGSYVLDLVSKTPVQEIRIIDADEFLQHNAFRAPGAPSIDELRDAPKKVD